MNIAKSLTINIRVGAVALEVIIVRDAGWGACSRGVVGARAARRTVTWVRINQAVGFAADGEATGIVGTLQGGWAVGAQVHTAVGNVEASRRGDGNGQVIAVYERDIIIV